jgi:hypothetical protein
VNPVLQRPAGFRDAILATARRFGGFFEPSHSLPLVLLPVRYVDPFLLYWLPKPETPESGKLGVGVRIRPNQEKGAASWATALLPEAEVPLAMGEVIALRLGFQDDRLKFRRLRSFSWKRKGFGYRHDGQQHRWRGRRFVTEDLRF